MSTQDSRSVRSSTTTGLSVQVTPSPFPAPTGYEAHVTGGIPPYTFAAESSPPNPPGVVVTPTGPNSGEVTVPPNTPPHTVVQVTVTDSSQPPQSAPASNRVA